MPEMPGDPLAGGYRGRAAAEARASAESGGQVLSTAPQKPSTKNQKTNNRLEA